MNKVLALSCEEDPHADKVVTHLTQKGVDIFRINTNRIREDYALTYDGAFHISGPERTVTLDKQWNIWNRRIMDPDLDDNIPEDIKQVIRTETKRTWEGLLFNHEGNVLNDPRSEYAANNKIGQMRFAQEQNISIPETLVTNDPAAFRRFYDKYETICHKLQKVAVIKKEDEQLIAYTNIVRPEHLGDSELIRNHPSLFQKYIDKEYEIRVTVTRDKVIPIAIHSQDAEISKVDFRKYDFDNVRYEHTRLPTNVEQFCHNIRDHYGLSFGAIDMIRTKKGEYVFLEINPNGQWLWLELKTGYPLTRDVAENLIR